MDAQSVKNTDTAMLKGYDAGKKVSGIKRHVAVDTLGLPHALVLTTADVTDRAGALQALEHGKAHLGQVQSVLCDGGYTGEPFAQGVKDILGEHVTVQIAKRSELHTFKVMPKRWIVERSFAWQTVMEELRTQTQHQFAVHPSGIFGTTSQKIVNRILWPGGRRIQHPVGEEVRSTLRELSTSRPPSGLRVITLLLGVTQRLVKERAS